MDTTNLVIETEDTHRPVELQVRVGAEVVLLVKEAPAEGGSGVVTLAGYSLGVQLPPGLSPGQTLAARVVAASSNQLLLRLIGDPEPEPAGALARVAGALAVSGDAELVVAACALAPPEFALPLPSGDALSVSEWAGGEGPGAEATEVMFVLHSALIGPIAVRLRLAGGVVAAEVEVEREVLALACGCANELGAALERATGRPARVGVAVRGARASRLAPLRVAEVLDAYA
jgi:hypothetical protein